MPLLHYVRLRDVVHLVGLVLNLVALFELIIERLVVLGLSLAVEEQARLRVNKLALRYRTCSFALLQRRVGQSTRRAALAG